MTDVHMRGAEARLRAARERPAVVLEGETAHPDVDNSECHRGSAEELALLKVPGVALDPDLLRRSWFEPARSRPGAALRRILPQTAEAPDAGQDNLLVR